LRYFAGPDVPRYVLFTVGYTWFCSLSIIILVPADIWAVTFLFWFLVFQFCFWSFHISWFFFCVRNFELQLFCYIIC
jgi:hypothetical protein